MAIDPAGHEAARPAIWVLDDSPIEGQMAKRALEARCNVIVFNEGSRFLEMVAGHPPPPDALVLDWIMPGLSGLEVLEFLRSRPGSDSLPVLVLTALGGAEQVVECLSAGANDYLAKPYAPAELQARMEALIRGSQLRARAERAEAMLRAVLAQFPDAIVTVGLGGQLVFANEAAGRAFGHAPEAMVGKNLAELAPDLKIDQLLLGGAAPLPDVMLGDRLYAPRVSVPVAHAGGHATLALRDMTEARRNEARTLDFYSMVAHEMRSPLSALLMRTQLLLRGMRGELLPAAAAEVTKMSGQIRGLVGLINDFLAISQMERGAFPMETASVDMAEVAAAAVSVYQPLADAKNISLDCDAPAGTSIVRGDARRLEQVLVNLVSNSIKYTPSEGKVRVSVSAEGEQVVTAVSDNGMGIPNNALPGLFQKWNRVPGSSAAVEGTGLGLVIVREIVEAHGGSVGVQSAPGQGSNFWFKLPRGTDAAVGPRP